MTPVIDNWIKRLLDALSPKDALIPRATALRPYFSEEDMTAAQVLESLTARWLSEVCGGSLSFRSIGRGEVETEERAIGHAPLDLGVYPSRYKPCVERWTEEHQIDERRNSPEGVPASEFRDSPFIAQIEVTSYGSLPWDESRFLPVVSHKVDYALELPIPSYMVAWSLRDDPWRIFFIPMRKIAEYPADEIFNRRLGIYQH